MTASFDRVRPRAGGPATPPRSLHDSEGKRALFSSTDVASVRPNIGTVSVECSQCHTSTTLSPTAVVRAAVPSVLLSVGLGRGERESTVGLSRRRYGAWLRCPACGRRTWTRLTLHV
ncbi:MAG TPA: hypothetical protein VFT62_01625 [Mycobacteriales bacterium]|nr:hypothetical protein [Mycobacteriales bacterium]